MDSFLLELHFFPFAKFCFGSDLKKTKHLFIVFHQAFNKLFFAESCNHL